MHTVLSRTLALSILAGLAAPVLAQCTGNFNTPGVTFLGVWPSRIYAADLNHDGVADLVAMSTDQNAIQIVLGSHGRTFTPGASINLGAIPLGMTIAHVNRDGNLDIIVSCSGASSQVRVYRGNGNGTFTGATNYNLSNGGSSSISCTDVNFDGWPDLVVARANLTEVHVNNSGTFATASNFITGGSASELLFADLRNNSLPDMVYAPLSTGAATAKVFRNKGPQGGGIPNQFFSTPDLFSTSGGPQLATGATLTIGRFDADQSPDMLFQNQKQVVLMRNDGLGGMLAPVTYNADPLFARLSAIASGDLNNDGFADAVAVGPYQVSPNGMMNIWMNNRDGTLQNPRGYAGTWNGTPRDVVIADFDGDGLNDIAYAYTSLFQVGIRWNGFYTTNIQPLPDTTPGAMRQPAAFHVDAAGDELTYRWQRELAPEVWIDLDNGPTAGWDGNLPGLAASVLGVTTATLTLTPDTANGARFGSAHAVRYRCAITNPCGTQYTNPSTLNICFGDVNSDYSLDLNDFFQFLNDFDNSNLGADIDDNAGVDLNDFFYFLNLFDSSCS